MSSEISIEATGEKALSDLRSVLSALEAEDRPASAAALTVEFAERELPEENLEDTAEDPKPGRVSAGTKQHLGLTLIARYLEETESEGATRREVAEYFGEDPLDAEQIGTALSALFRRKELLEREKIGSGPTEMNRYTLTPEAEAELERLGGHPDAPSS